MLDRAAKMISERMDNMREQDALDGKTNASTFDYVLWAIEECESNDGLVVNIITT